MLDGLRARLGRWVALRHVRRRRPLAWSADPASRRVLLVLPAEAEALEAAWRFAEGLGLEAGRVTAVTTAEAVAYAPAAFVGQVRALGPVGPLGLPKRRAAEAVWAEDPEVALCLAAGGDLAAAYVAGASPAAFRVGLHGEGLEPFFDLMAGSAGSYEGALGVLAEVLGRLEPPALAAP